MQYRTVLMNRTVQHRRTAQRARGLSIVEMLISVVLSTVILAGIYASSRAQMYALQSQNTAMEVGPNEDITYALDFALGQILRTDSLGTTPLAEGVPTDGLLFRYFDTSDPPVELVPAPSLTTQQRDCVGTITVALRVTDEEPRSGDTLSAEATSQGAIRSRFLANF
jgi:Tfp pilus assembly protein PilW